MDTQFNYVEVAARNADVKRLVELAVKDPELGPIVKYRLKTKALLLYADNKVVGLSIPRKDTDGRYRAGPIYVLPEERQKGFGKAFIRSYFMGRKGRAFISVTNLASQALFKSCGFYKSGKKTKPKDELFEEWLYDPKSLLSQSWED